MTIAQVLLRYDAPGGVETMVRELSRELSRAGEPVRIFASDLYDEGRWERRPNSSRLVDGIPVERFPVYKRLIPGITLPLMPGLISGLVKARPTLIHAHSHRYGHVLQAALVADATGIPLVVSSHYHPADRGEPWRKAMLLRAQDHLFGFTAYRTAKAVVVETKNEARQLEDLVPPRKIHIIPPGLGLEEWGKLPSPEAARARLGLPARYILFAGRLARNKGLDVLVESWAALPPSDRIPLVLAGQDWGMRSELEASARRLGVAEGLRFLGNRPRDEYRAAFAGASLFVLPSEYEAFGLVLLEAMASGLPIVATRVGGVPEVVRDGQEGRLVEYGDRPALTQALRELLTDPALGARLSAAGRRRVAEEYTWERTAARFRALYRSVGG